MMSEELSLPRGWQTTSLEKIASWGSGGTPSRSIARYFQGTIPWIKTGELEAKYIRETQEHITEDAIKNSSAKIFPKGSVGIAMYGATIGKLSIWGMDASTNQACAVGVPNDAVYNEFLYYYLLSERQALIKAGKGGAQPNLSQGVIKEWPIDLPPSNEQHSIVAKIEELFSELDKGIDNLKTAQAQLKVYRQALLKHAFEGKLTSQWRSANQDKLETAEALLKRIQQERTQRYEQQFANWKATGQGSKPKTPKAASQLTAEELAELSELPKGWAWIKYGELIENSQNGISKRSGSTGQEAIVLRLADIFEQKVSVKNTRKIMLTDNELDNYRLTKNDLLCIRVNGSPDLVGRMVIIQEDTDIAYCDHFIRYRLLTNICNSKYLSSYFNTVPIRRYIDLNKVSSAGQNTVNQEMIGSITIAFCCKAEQDVIVELLEEKLSEVDYLNQTITTALQQSEALRQSILKKAFSGQLVPQDSNDEPASALLARIQSEMKMNGKLTKVQHRINKVPV